MGKRGQANPIAPTHGKLFDQEIMLPHRQWIRCMAPEDRVPTGEGSTNSAKPICIVARLGASTWHTASATLLPNYSAAQLTALSLPESTPVCPGSGESGRTLIDLDADTIDIGIKESIKVVGQNVPHDNGAQRDSSEQAQDTYTERAKQQSVNALPEHTE